MRGSGKQFIVTVTQTECAKCGLSLERWITCCISGNPTACCTSVSKPSVSNQICEGNDTWRNRVTWYKMRTTQTGAVRTSASEKGYLHNTEKYKRRSATPSVGFVPTTPATRRPQTARPPVPAWRHITSHDQASCSKYWILRTFEFSL